jgi:hypothetical protein
MSESKQYMIARDDCYEPDDEDLAYDLYKEDQFDSLRRYYIEATSALRDYRKYTDRQLCGLSSEMKFSKYELWSEYRYDVTSDTYEVNLNSETSITVPRNESYRYEDPRPLTRKDKRRRRKDARKAKRFLKEFNERAGRNPAQSLVVRKT